MSHREDRGWLSCRLPEPHGEDNEVHHLAVIQGRFDWVRESSPDHKLGFLAVGAGIRYNFFSILAFKLH